MTKVLRQILDLFLPPRCIKCGKVQPFDDGLCEECFNEINFIARPYCERCGEPFQNMTDPKIKFCGKCLAAKNEPFKMSRSVFKYEDASKNMIIAFKFNDKTENAKLFAKWMKNGAKDIIDNGADLLVPVPLHYKRLFKRRYNQSALLARELSKLTGIKVNYSSLARHKNTKPQVEFSGKARVRNVKNAFKVKKPARIEGRKIILIDDVMTTGSTLKECVAALKKAGAKEVSSLTLARVVRD